LSGARGIADNFRQVNNSVKALQAFTQGSVIANVAMDELETRVGSHVKQRAPAVHQVVQSPHAMAIA
jgi:hypothetical protein